MAHIQITYGSSGDKPPAQVLVDGHDVTAEILHEGFGVEFDPESRRVVVSMRLRADRIDMDLPDALIAATQADPHTLAVPKSEEN